jgi:hypothetical protein
MYGFGEEAQSSLLILPTSTTTIFFFLNILLFALPFATNSIMPHKSGMIRSKRFCQIPSPLCRHWSSIILSYFLCPVILVLLFGYFVGFTAFPFIHPFYSSPFESNEFEENIWKGNNNMYLICK